MQPLSFQNYGDPTTNGSSLGTTGIAANNLSIGNPVGSSVSGGSNLAGAGVTDTSTVLSQSGGQSATGQAGSGFFSKDGGAGLILGGVQVLGNLWNSYQSHKLAKEQMSFAREQWQTNLANQTQTYNTALEDRIRARHNTEGKGADQTDRYIKQHSL